MTRRRRDRETRRYVSGFLPPVPETPRHRVRIFMYFPMIGARSLFVFAGASFSGVMIVFRSASLQEQLRAGGSILTASRIIALDVSMFFLITARTASTVTDSSLWCQQS